MAAVFRGPPVLSAVAVASLLLSSFSPKYSYNSSYTYLWYSICVVEAAKIMARTRRGARRNKATFFSSQRHGYGASAIF